MTAPNPPELLPVTQEIRDRASSAVIHASDRTFGIRTGECDDDPIVQAFASEAAAEKLAGAAKPFTAFDDGRAPTHLVITNGSSMARRQLTIGDCRKLAAALTEYEATRKGGV